MSKKGFTGPETDSIGRKRCYRDGKEVHCNLPGTPASSPAKDAPGSTGALDHISGAQLVDLLRKRKASQDSVRKAKTIAQLEKQLRWSKKGSAEFARLQKAIATHRRKIQTLLIGIVKRGLYSHLSDPPNVGAGKDFTGAQKVAIVAANKVRNGGVVKSDLSGNALIQPAKSQKGITPSPQEWQIDHVVPRDKGGTNSYRNAQVLSRSENRAKSNK